MTSWAALIKVDEVLRKRVGLSDGTTIQISQVLVGVIASLKVMHDTKTYDEFDRYLRTLIESLNLIE